MQPSIGGTLRSYQTTSVTFMAPDFLLPVGQQPCSHFTFTKGTKPAHSGGGWEGSGSLWAAEGCPCTSPHLDIQAGFRETDGESFRFSGGAWGMCEALSGTIFRPVQNVSSSLRTSLPAGVPPVSLAHYGHCQLVPSVAGVCPTSAQKPPGFQAPQSQRQSVYCLQDPA